VASQFKSKTMGFERNEISAKANGGTEIARNLLEQRLDPELLKNFQIILSRYRQLDMEKIRIMNVHDLPEDPESVKFKDKKFQDNFHKFVFVSDWQYQRYQLMHGIPYNEKSVVLETGIETAPSSCFDIKKQENIIRLVYTSTPQRGLEILVPVFRSLAQKYPNIHLDVFSSFKIYGWDEADKPYEKLFEEIKNHPQMTYHGFVPNQTVKDHLLKSHIFAYPSIWIETSCRAMIEAMSAGLVCVHPNFGALPETSGGLNVMYQGDWDNKQRHAEIFYNYLEAAIKLVINNQHENIIRFNKLFVDNRYNMDRITHLWEQTLTRLLNQYPTTESRQAPKEMFIYRTTP